MPSMTNMLTVGAVAIVAYCVYFDRKRRSDPNFRAKLKEKRLKAQRSKETDNEYDIPIFKDPTQMQAYFLDQVAKSDEKMMTGNFEEACLHLALATVVCSQKSEFLRVMQNTLPAQFFQLLLEHYHAANERYLKKLLENSGGPVGELKQTTTTTPDKQPQFNDTDIE